MVTYGIKDDFIKKLKEMGYPLVLATNPIFPRVATMQRIDWAGLDVEDFELVTVYENFNYSKPNPENEDISKYPHGSFEDLLEYIETIN